jgi:MFS transporter, DHA1 family, multidrug resistance protein
MYNGGYPGGEMINRPGVILLLSYICIGSVSASLITPALPAIQHAFQLSHGSLEWIISIFLFGYVIGQLFYGPLANRYGRKTALQIGLWVNVLGVFVCLLAAYLPNYPLLLTGRLLTALGTASGLSCTFILINESLSPSRAKHAMSFAMVSFTLGIGLSVTVGGLVTQYLSWEDCFWVQLIHGAGMLYLTRHLAETLKKPVPIRPRSIISSLAHNISHKKLLIFSLAAGLSSAVAYGYAASAPLFAHVKLHLSASQYGYWNLINMLGMLGSGFLSVSLIKRYGARYTLLFSIIFLGLAIVSLCLVSFTGSSSNIWFFGTTTALYLFSGMMFPTTSYFASNAIADRANASSVMSFINIGSAMMGVIVLGYLPLPSVVSFTAVLVGFFILVLCLVLPYLIGDNKLPE